MYMSVIIHCQNGKLARANKKLIKNPVDVFAYPETEHKEIVNVKIYNTTITTSDYWN